MSKKLKAKALLLTLCASTTANAVVYAPNPNASNQVLWDTILGAGSFDTWSYVLRMVPIATVFLVVAWIVLGLYQACIVNGKITMTDLMIYAWRLLMILIAAIAFVNA